MRILIFSICLLLLCGCALPPSKIPYAPQNQAKAVVFDIDGTLTPRPIQTWKVRDDAVRAVQFFAGQGYKIIYLSARSKLFQKPIPNWLTKNGFPEGSIKVPETAEDGKNYVRFKTRMLREFQQNGWQIKYAFGDSTTDFDAYAAVGIPEENVFALQRKGASSCEKGLWQKCLTGWAEYLNTKSN